MIIIQADFNHLDTRGRLRLDDLAMHDHTPFHEIARKGSSITFVDGEDAVDGHLVLETGVGWVGEVDWSTQQVIESWPPATVATR
ncbi:MAG: hypothetical protein KF809_11430 [Chloroflexi bacterium]|nr:hypothetical protein [Chloroflexota bacterium]